VVPLDLTPSQSSYSGGEGVVYHWENDKEGCNLDREFMPPG